MDGGSMSRPECRKRQLSLQNRTIRELLERGKIKELNVLGDRKASSGELGLEDFRLGSVEDILQAVLKSSKTVGEEPLLVLDSWDSLANKLEPLEKIKAEQALLVIAEANKAKLLFVSEENALTNTDYVVDAVVQLEDDVFQERRIRRIVWKKLRGSRIPQRSYLYTLEGGKFTILENAHVPWPEPLKGKGAFPFRKAHDEYHFSTGSDDLDDFLRGGFKRGSLVLLELGKHVGDYWHVPIARSIESNFLANGGCTLILPMGNVPPTLVKEEFTAFFDKKTLEANLRIGHSNPESERDRCFVRLAGGRNPATSLRETRTVIRTKVLEMKSSGGAKDEKHCFYFIGMDMLENLFPVEDLASTGSNLASGMKHSGDLAMVASRQGSSLLDELMNVCDVHLKLEEVDNALLLYSVKPRSELFHVEYDYTSGCSKIKLIRVV
jgi:KaiC/GvpD/RAD55 family RecA-like ATPase